VVPLVVGSEDTKWGAAPRSPIQKQGFPSTARLEHEPAVIDRIGQDAKQREYFLVQQFLSHENPESKFLLPARRVDRLLERTIAESDAGHVFFADP
jgi:hypothetical protein